MRWLAAVLLLAANGATFAQHDELAACLGRIAAVPRLAPIAAKLAGAVPANTSYADRKEQQLIAEWAAARADCVQAANRAGSAQYRPPLQIIGIDSENRLLAAAEALYNLETTWSGFSRERQAIDEEQRARIAALRQRIQSQNSALEQADRLSRERAETQRDLEDAGLQARLAQQQIQALQEAARRAPSGRAGRNYGYGASALPLRPYRNCFQFGGRTVCTYL